MRTVAAGLAAALSVIGQAAADPGSPGAMAIFGYQFVRDTGARCSVSMELDQEKFISSVPSLKLLGMLNADFVTQTRVNLQPTVLAVAFAMEMTPSTVKEIFDKDSKAQGCVFNQYMTGTDDFGNSQRKLAFSFSFTRDLYLKVNWEKFEYFKLPFVAREFNFGPDINLAMQQEKAAMPPE